MWVDPARPATHVLIGWASCFLAHQKKMGLPDLTDQISKSVWANPDGMNQPVLITLVSALSYLVK